MKTGINTKQKRGREQFRLTRTNSFPNVLRNPALLLRDVPSSELFTKSSMASLYSLFFFNIFPFRLYERTDVSYIDKAGAILVVGSSPPGPSSSGGVMSMGAIASSMPYAQS